MQLELCQQWVSSCTTILEEQVRGLFRWRELVYNPPTLKGVSFPSALTWKSLLAFKTLYGCSSTSFFLIDQDAIKSSDMRKTSS